MSSEAVVVQRLLVSLTNKIKQSASSKMNAQGISNSLNGLQGMSSNQTEVVDLLQILIPKFLESKEIFPSFGIGCAMMGFFSMSAERAEVQQLLGMMSEQLEYCREKFNSITLVSAFTGLRLCSDEQPVVRRILASLADKIVDCNIAELPPSASSRILSSLRSMRGNSEELHAVIGAVAYKIISPSNSTTIQTQSYSSSDIANGLFGLQYIDAERSPEVRILLSKLADYLEVKGLSLTGKDIAQALYGLKSLSSQNVDEVYKILTIIERNIKTTLEGKNSNLVLLTPQGLGMAMLGIKWSPIDRIETRKVLRRLSKMITSLDSQSCGNILYSMSNMDSKYKEVRGFITEITPHIARIKEPLSAQELANSYFGLQGLDSKYSEVIELLEQLNYQLVKSVGTVKLTSQGIGNGLSGLQSMSCADSDEVLKTLGLFADIIDVSEFPMSSEDIANALFGKLCNLSCFVCMS